MAVEFILSGAFLSLLLILVAGVSHARREYMATTVLLLAASCSAVTGLALGVLVLVWGWV